MERSAALELLTALHSAQNSFYAGGDDAGLRALLCHDVVWTVPGDNAVAGVYTGLDQVLDYFARRRDVADKTFTMHRRDVLVGDGPEIVALTDGEAVVRGRSRRWSTAGLYAVRDGKIARCRLLPFDPAEFDDIWSTG